MDTLTKAPITKKLLFKMVDIINLNEVVGAPYSLLYCSVTRKYKLINCKNKLVNNKLYTKDKMWVVLSTILFHENQHKVNGKKVKHD